MLQWSASAFEPRKILSILGFSLTPLAIIALIESSDKLGVVRASPFGVHPNLVGGIDVFVISVLLHSLFQEKLSL